jgi:hypothetical protein
MKKASIILAALAATIAVSVIACNSSQEKSANQEGLVATAPSPDSLIARGEYLVSIMGCHDCHSPKKIGPLGPEIDSSRALSGHPATMPIGPVEPKGLEFWVLFNHTATAFVGPWGVSYAANLTSDQSGIGDWSEAQFFKAIRQGKYKGLDNSRPLLPPMPWMVYANATDDDLRAIFAFLKSTPPVNNVVPASRSLQEVTQRQPGTFQQRSKPQLTALINP